MRLLFFKQFDMRFGWRGSQDLKVNALNLNAIPEISMLHARGWSLVCSNRCSSTQSEVLRSIGSSGTKVLPGPWSNCSALAVLMLLPVVIPSVLGRADDCGSWSLRRGHHLCGRCLGQLLETGAEHEYSIKLDH